MNVAQLAGGPCLLPVQRLRSVCFLARIGQKRLAAEGRRVILRQHIAGSAWYQVITWKAVAAANRSSRSGDGVVTDTGSKIDGFAEKLTTLFPVWVLLGSALGISRPQAFDWFHSGYFTTSLGFLMLSMGLTLTFKDFKECLKRPEPIGVGYAAQYVIKPLLGFVISKVLNLSPALATGLILVSCCPGGQASNVATYIAHGDVALSVLMTTASTLGAIFMTPLLTKTLAGTLVPVDAKGLALSTFQVVLVPTIVGVLVNEFFPGLVKRIKPVLPLVGVAITTLLCASPCAQVAPILRSKGADMAIAVGLLHAAAFSLGYFLCKGLSFDEKTARTVSIETGMQSAALGFLLAQKHFPDPMVAIPSAVSVVFMALLGSALAVYWRNKPIALSN